MTKNNQLERTYLEAVLNIRTGPYFVCSLTLAEIDGPYFRMVLIFGWSLFSVIYGMPHGQGPALQGVSMEISGIRVSIIKLSYVPLCDFFENKRGNTVTHEGL